MTGCQTEVLDLNELSLRQLIRSNHIFKSCKRYFVIKPFSLAKAMLKRCEPLLNFWTIDRS